MFRLWNLLDGRCLFKRLVGLDSETNKVAHKAVMVKWEPTLGNHYAILYERKLEVYEASKNDPISTVTTDTPFNMFEFVSPTELVIADVQGKLTFVKNITEEKNTNITLINTKVNRFKSIATLPGCGVLATASTEGKLSFYDIEHLRQFHLEIGNAKAIKQVKSKSRFLCLAINHLKP